MDNQREVPSKLAVLLHADVVDSTALVRADESLAHRRIRDGFGRFAEIIAAHDGAALETRGDALVAEFSKASDAVNAAWSFQQGNRASAKACEDGAWPVIRIGIAAGEVVVADGTVTGEGIVLAQRLEQLAGAHGICVQDAVRQILPARLPFAYEDLGEQTVKGFDAPLRAFRVRSNSPAQPSPQDAEEPGDDSTAQPGSAASDKPTIAVLPFANLGGDPEQQYFCDGIVEDIITELSHFKGLSVIARNSSFALGEQNVDIVEAGRRLNARFVLEGSIRRSGERIRISAQLIDARDGTHVWAGRYDRETEDIFDLQDEVVRVIATTLIGQVQQADQASARRKSASSLQAYDCVVLGLDHFYKWTQEDNRRARELFEQAIAIDPNYAAAYAWLAEVHFRDGLNAWSASHEDSFARLFEFAQRAVALDANDSNTHKALGIAHLFRGEHDRARYHLEHALSLNPSNTDAMVHLARCESLAGDPERGAELLAAALRFNPLANYQWFSGQVEYIAGHYAEAVRALSSLSSPNVLVHAFLAAGHARLGNNAAAREAASQFVDEASALIARIGAPEPSSWIDFVTSRYPFRQAEDAARLADGLRDAGLN